MDKWGETGRWMRCFARISAASDCEACSVAASLGFSVSMDVVVVMVEESLLLLRCYDIPPLHHTSRRLHPQTRRCRPSQTKLEYSLRSHDTGSPMAMDNVSRAVAGGGG